MIKCDICGKPADMAIRAGEGKMLPVCEPCLQKIWTEEMEKRGIPIKPENEP